MVTTGHTAAVTAAAGLAEAATAAGVTGTAPGSEAPDSRQEHHEFEFQLEKTQIRRKL